MMSHLMIAGESIHRIVVLMLTVGLSGCAGVGVSSRPVYPESWPTLVSLHTGRTCPEISGKYRAISDEPAPLVYPPGGEPRQMFMFVTYGKAETVPRLGRRVLPWHLAGTFHDRDYEVMNALTRYASAVEAHDTIADPKDEAGWVQVQELPDSRIEVHAGLHELTLLSFTLREEAQGLWKYKSQVYECNNGGLVVVGGFPPPTVENPTSRSSAAIGAEFTFYSAADGSLVALENAYFGPTTGSVVFKKWWRWRRIE